MTNDVPARWEDFNDLENYLIVKDYFKRVLKTGNLNQAYSKEYKRILRDMEEMDVTVFFKVVTEFNPNTNDTSCEFKTTGV